MPLSPSKRMSDTGSSSVHACFLAGPATRPDPGAVRIEFLQALNPSKGQEASGKESSPGWEGPADTGLPLRGGREAGGSGQGLSLAGLCPGCLVQGASLQFPAPSECLCSGSDKKARGKLSVSNSSACPGEELS